MDGRVGERDVEDAERRLVPRVVDPDRARGEEVAAARDVGDPDVELVRSVRVVRRAERHLEAGSPAGRPRVLREGLHDVGPRQVDVRAAGRRDAVRLVRPIDVEVDVRDEVPVQREPGHADVTRDESAFRRDLDRPDGLCGTPFGRALRERGRAERQEDRRHHRKDQSVELHQSSSPGSRGLRFTVSGRYAEQSGNHGTCDRLRLILGAAQSPVNAGVRRIRPGPGRGRAPLRPSPPGRTPPREPKRGVRKRRCPRPLRAPASSGHSPPRTAPIPPRGSRR